MEKLEFGYVEPKDFIERSFGVSSTDEYLAIPKEDLYDFDKVFSENFYYQRDKFIVLKVCPEDNDISTLIPDTFTKCLSTPEILEKVGRLKFLVMDYDTLFATRYDKIRNYDSNFFSAEERLLFESLLTKFKRNEFKTFRWEKSRIGYELNINRHKRDKIILRFKDLGIIKSATAKSCKGKNGRNANSYFFNLDCKRILELLPEIYAQLNYEKVKHDLYKYLAPALKEDK